MSFDVFDHDISLAQFILGFVLVQRLVELWVARRNTDRLLADGAVEHGSEHYPFLILLHAAWLAALVYTTPPGTPIVYPWLIVYVVLQLARIWVIVSLGRSWTTRIITRPGKALVRRGPYRYIRHPNYAIVTAEIAVLPLVFGHWPIALGFSLLNMVVLRERIRVENEALAERRGVD